MANLAETKKRAAETLARLQPPNLPPNPSPTRHRPPPQPPFSRSRTGSARRSGRTR